MWRDEEQRKRAMAALARMRAMQDGSYYGNEDKFDPEEIPLPPQEPQRGLVGGIVADGLSGTKDAVKGIIHGINTAGEEAVNTIHDLGVGAHNLAVSGVNYIVDKMEFDDYYKLDKIESDWKANFDNDYYKPEMMSGTGTAAISQFMLGFLGSGAVLKGVGLAGKAAKAGKIADYAVNVGLRGAITDAAFFDPLEKRLSNMLEQVPGLNAFVPDYLSAKPDDSKAEGRLKNALEGLLVGAAVDGVFSGLKLLKKLRSVDKAGLTTKQMKEIQKDLQKIDEFLPEVKKIEDAGQPLVKDTPDVSVKEAGDIPLSFEERQRRRGQPSVDLSGLSPSERKAARKKLVNGQLPEGVNDVSELLKTDAAARPAEDITTEAAQDVADDAVASFTGKYKELVEKDAPLSEFKVLKSLRNNIRTADDVHRVIDTLEQSGVFSRDPNLTNPKHYAETLEAAQEILDGAGIHVDIREFVRQQSHELGEQLTTAPEKIVLLNGLVVDAAGAMRRAIASGDGAAQQDALGKLIAIASEYDRIQTGAGRTLQTFAMVDDSNARLLEAFGIDREAARSIGPEETAKLMDEKLALMSEVEKSDLAMRISTIENVAQLGQTLKITPKGNKFALMYNEVWLNGLLSGPMTHVTNIFSGMSQVLANIPMYKLFGAADSFVRNGFTWGRKEKELLEDVVYTIPDLYASFTEAWRVASAAFKFDTNILKPQNSVIELNTKMLGADIFGADPNSIIGRMLNGLGDTARLPSRFLMTGDEFTSQLSYRMNLRREGIQQARDLFERGMLEDIVGAGTKEEQIARFVERKFSTYLRDAVMDDGTVVESAVGVSKDALEAAQHATYTRPLRGDSIPQWIKSGADKHPVIRRFFAPFVRTPVNIVNEAFMATPILNKLSKNFAEDIAAGGKRAAIARGRQAVGGLIWITGLLGAATGSITGGGPAHPKQRDMLLEKGWKPYSIRVGDKYISYGRIEPMATILSIAADVMETKASLDPEDDLYAQVEDLISMLPYTVYNSIASKTFLRTVSDTFSMLNNPKLAERWFEEQVQSHVPALAAQMRRAIDPEVREVRGLLEGIRNKIPFFSADLPQKYSWLTGEPISIYGGRLAAISPIVGATSPDDPVAAEMLKFSERWMDEGGVKWADSYSVRTTPMTPAQRSDYDRLQGTVKLDGMTMHQALTNLIESKEYDKESPIDRKSKTDEKFVMMNKVIQRYRNEAYKELFKLYPDLAAIATQSKRRDDMRRLGEMTLSNQNREHVNKAAEQLKLIADF